MSSPRLTRLVLVSLICTPTAASGAVTAGTAIVVRVYDATGVLTGTNREALEHARKTLDGASIDVIWRLCPHHPACQTPMGSGELAIRIVRAQVPARDPGRLPLGDALIDTHAGAGVLATIYADRVEWLARRAGADRGALLGRAIAHELGHLLLATTRHAPVGLMRAYWSQEEVRHSQPRDWSFAPTELAAMRRRVEALGRDARVAWGTR